MLDRRAFMSRLGGCALVSAGAGLLPSFLHPERASAGAPKQGLVGRRPSPWFTQLGDRRVRCELCPHRCEIDADARGRCGVRENKGGRLDTLVYGNPAAVNIDPIEKKPLYHVLPGTKTLTVASAGCNLHCSFCQVWEISQAGPEDTYNHPLSPEQVIERAELYACQSIASSYVEPAISMEYMLDVARLCQTRSTLHVMHSAGYINPAPLEEACQVLDAACIDLKGFDEGFYREFVGGSLGPVLETLRRLKSHRIHTEIVNLLIPGKNDDPQSLRAMCRWIVKELGPDSPLHFFRFYPRYKFKSIPPMPVASLERARALAIEEGLHYAYIANVPEHAGKHTYCPGCGKLVIKRDGFSVELEGLVDGRCAHCKHAIPGVWRPRSITQGGLPESTLR